MGTLLLLEAGKGTIAATSGGTNNLVFDGKAHGNSSIGTTTATLTTTQSNDLIYLLIYDGVGNVVSDVAGLTWTQRAGSPFISGDGHNIAIYTAVAASPLVADVITVTGGASFTTIDVFGIAGANTASPFDGSVQTAEPDPVTITTTNANTMIIGGFADGTGNPTQGSGYILVSGADFAMTEYKIVSTQQVALSVTQGTGAGGAHIGVADAVKSS